MFQVMHQWKKKLKQKTVKSHSKPKDKHKKNWKKQQRNIEKISQTKICNYSRISCQEEKINLKKKLNMKRKHWMKIC